ncbi:MAG: ATP-binding protein [Prevotellaceae bacterium]|nr:ATP-binding protein [Prevotellaceae bacterium]
MLKKFAVTNYRGFSKRIEFDLSNPKNYEFNSFAIKDGIIKNGIVYGPNGSGKSNLTMAVFDIVNHLSQKWKKPDYYVNFVYSGNASQPVEFEYSFALGKYNVLYRYSKEANGMLMSESLQVDGHQVFNREKGIFEIDETNFPMDSVMKDNLTSNENHVSIVNFLLTSYPLSKDHYLLLLQQFVNSMLWFRCLENREFIGLESKIVLLDEYIIKNRLIDDFSEFISNVSSQQFKFARPNLNDKVLYCVFGSSRVPFNQIASTGTHSLMLLYYWIKQMDKASFVFIDEFDAFYHFKLAYEVCRRLFALDCQVFTTSHNTYLMTNDLLRPDCNFILADNTVKAMSECTEKELRFGHNIEKMFRGGTFSV